MRHSSRHFTEIGQPFFPAHFLFQISDFRQIFEDSNQTRTPALLLQQRYGHAEDAKAVYQRIIASGHPREAPIAHLNMGILFESTGDIASAKAELQHAIDTPTFEAAPKAMALRTLGEILEQEGDIDGARAARERADSCDGIGSTER